MANPSRWSLSRLLSNDAHPTRANANSSTSNNARTLPEQHQQTPHTPQTPQNFQRHPIPQSHTSTFPQNNRAPHAQSSRSSGSTTSRISSARVRAQTHRSRRDTPTEFSAKSSSAVPDSHFFAEDFMLGSGMVVIQPSTGKIVLLHEAHRDVQGRTYHRWFLPKGRKDVGETLEQTALREAYEESGYHVDFLPVIMRHNAPAPLTSLDNQRLRPVTEPIFVSMFEYGDHDGGRNRRGGEYLTFWYIGQVPENAMPDRGTRMPDEENYETYFLTPDEALGYLTPQCTYYHIVKTAYELWLGTVQMQAAPEYVRYIADVARQEALLMARAMEGVEVAEVDEGAGHGA